MLATSRPSSSSHSGWSFQPSSVEAGKKAVGARRVSPSGR
jgi:hypothetical protein